ncbi:MAG: flagellar biosynthesis protein FliR [Synergistales bacterium]|nr:flagellar biosynthesis protein FliR [Synergistales bacterium]
MPAVNVQALLALLLFGIAIMLAKMVNNINRGDWPGGKAWVFYLRMLLGFVFAASITFAFYAFAGINILNH